MSRDDNTDDPMRDDPPDEAEMAQAKAFAQLVDQMIQGRDVPPAMASDQRAMIDVAGIVRASTRDVELDPQRGQAIIDEAIARAGAATSSAPVKKLSATAKSAVVDDNTPLASAPHAPAGEDTSKDAGTIDLAAHRRKRLRPLVPWAVAGIAAAAALALALIRPVAPTQQIQMADAQALSLPIEQQSRPSDDLIGEIPRSRVADARERLDVIYSDRMAGFRAQRLGGKR